MKLKPAHPGEPIVIDRPEAYERGRIGPPARREAVNYVAAG